MANTFINLGFESAGAIPGLADGWTITQLLQNQLLAEYGPTFPGTSVEDFEDGWSTNELAIFVFLGKLQDICPALYDDPNAPEDFEDFEEEWSDNEFFAFDISGVSTDAANYDSGTPEDVEDFEEEWDSNEDFLFVFTGGDLSDASYDSGTPEDFEDFEEEWSTNEDFLFSYVEHVGSVEFKGGAFQDIIDTGADFIAEGFLVTHAILIRGSGFNDNTTGTIDTVATTQLDVGVNPSLTNEAASPATTSLTMDLDGSATWDGLNRERFEGTWTSMTTPF